MRILCAVVAFVLAFGMQAEAQQRSDKPIPLKEIKGFELTRKGVEFREGEKRAKGSVVLENMIPAGSLGKLTTFLQQGDRCDQEGRTTTEDKQLSGTCRDPMGREYNCTCTSTFTFTCNGGEWKYEGDQIQYCYRTAAPTAPGIDGQTQGVDSN